MLNQIISLFSLVLFFVSIFYMIRMRKDQSATLVLTSKDKIVIWLVCLFDPILGGAIFYYGLKKKFPEKAKKANRISMIAFLIDFVLVILLAVLLQGTPSHKVSDNFLGKVNEILATKTVMADDLTTAYNTIQGIADNKDSQGAIQDLNTSLDKINDAKVKAQDLKNEAADFKVMVNAVSDPAIKNSGLKFIDSVEQLATIFSTVADDLGQIAEFSKKEVQDFAAGKTPAPYNSALSQKLQVDSSTAQTITENFSLSIKELKTAAGLQ